MRPQTKAALLLVLAVLVAHGRSLGCEFVWDDHENIVGNPNLRTLAGLWRTWADPWANQQYYPLTYSSFWLEFQLWGLRPFGYHLANVLLQAANAVLVWRVLARLRLPGAWLAALIFAVHPAQVETVAWVTERKNLLSLCLGLLAADLYLRWRGVALDGDGDQIAAHAQKTWLLAFGVFALALLAKTVAAVLVPALLVALLALAAANQEIADFSALRRRFWRELLPLLPFIALGMALARLTAHLEREHMGARFDWPFAHRLLVAGQAFWHYLGSLLWPFHPVFVPPRFQIDESSPAQWMAVAAVLGLLALPWALRRRWGWWPLAGALCYAGLLVPALGFFNLIYLRFSHVQAHFQYFATVPACALLGAAAVAVVQQAGFRVVPVLAAAVVGLAALSVHATAPFHNLETLFLDTVQKNPDAWLAQYNLGYVAQNRGDVRTAQDRYQQALRTDPDNVPALTNSGALFFKAGQLPQALERLQRAARVAPQDGTVLKALALAQKAAGQAKLAAATYRALAQVNGNAPETLVSLAALLATSADEGARNGPEAVALLRPLCPTLKKRQAECWDILAAAYAETGRFDLAIATLQPVLDAGALPAAAGRMELYRRGVPYRVGGGR